MAPQEHRVGRADCFASCCGDRCGDKISIFGYDKYLKGNTTKACGDDSSSRVAGNYCKTCQYEATVRALSSRVLFQLLTAGRKATADLVCSTTLTVAVRYGCGR
jgi:hypothetical protein